MHICKLCRENVETLENSHLIPRAAYKYIAPEGTTRIEVNPTDAFINTKHKTASLLCKKCEDLFSKHGETPMGLLWSTDKGFPLLSKVLQSTPSEPGCYHGNCLPVKDQNALIYFAVSVLWRANVWPENINQYKGALGDHYQEEFRKFLLLKSQLKNVKILIQINENSDATPQSNSSALISFPSVTKTANSRVHEFVILGIYFYVHIGQSAKDINDYFDKGSDIIIFTEDFKKMQWHKDLTEKMRNEITARGKLADQRDDMKKQLNKTI